MATHARHTARAPDVRATSFGELLELYAARISAVDVLAKALEKPLDTGKFDRREFDEILGMRTTAPQAFEMLEMVCARVDRDRSRGAFGRESEAASALVATLARETEAGAIASVRFAHAARDLEVRLLRPHGADGAELRTTAQRHFYARLADEFGAHLARTVHIDAPELLRAAAALLRLEVGPPDSSRDVDPIDAKREVLEGLTGSEARFVAERFTETVFSRICRARDLPALLAVSEAATPDARRALATSIMRLLTETGDDGTTVLGRAREDLRDGDRSKFTVLPATLSGGVPRTPLERVEHSGVLLVTLSWLISGANSSEFTAESALVRESLWHPAFQAESRHTIERGSRSPLFTALAVARARTAILAGEDVPTLEQQPTSELVGEGFRILDRLHGEAPSLAARVYSIAADPAAEFSAPEELDRLMTSSAEILRLHALLRILERREDADPDVTSRLGCEAGGFGWHPAADAVFPRLSMLGFRTRFERLPGIADGARTTEREAEVARLTMLGAGELPDIPYAALLRLGLCAAREISSEGGARAANRLVVRLAAPFQSDRRFHGTLAEKVSHDAHLERRKQLRDTDESYRAHLQRMACRSALLRFDVTLAAALIARVGDEETADRLTGDFLRLMDTPELDVHGLRLAHLGVDVSHEPVAQMFLRAGESLLHAASPVARAATTAALRLRGLFPVPVIGSDPDCPLPRLVDVAIHGDGIQARRALDGIHGAWRAGGPDAKAVRDAVNRFIADLDERDALHAAAQLGLLSEADDGDPAASASSILPPRGERPDGQDAATYSVLKRVHSRMESDSSRLEVLSMLWIGLALGWTESNLGLQGMGTFPRELGELRRATDLLSPALARHLERRLMTELERMITADPDSVHAVAAYFAIFPTPEADLRLHGRGVTFVRAHFAPNVVDRAGIVVRRSSTEIRNRLSDVLALLPESESETVRSKLGLGERGFEREESESRSSSVEDRARAGRGRRSDPRSRGGGRP